jgi:hypothetical protein
MGRITWSRALKIAGAFLIVAGFASLLASPDDYGVENASFPNNTMGATEREVDYQGWATILLGFMILGSGYYFKLREARRADRVEAREVADRKQRGDDLH